MKRVKFLVSLLIIALMIPNLVQAQENETLVVGQVFDKFDRTPLESVSVYFKGSNKHVSTNDEGYFLIRSSDKVSVLVFSLIGYNKVEVKVKSGESAGIEVLMEEKMNLLDDLMVSPGANPANDLMKRVVASRKKNMVFARQTANEQNLVFLSKKDSRWENNRIFEQFKVGNLSENDSTLLAPLYMEETRYTVSKKEKEVIKRDHFNTSETAQNIIIDLLGGLNTDVNFYRNSVFVLGKGMVSPLANVGKSFYRYYLVDSILTEKGKEYLLHFKSKNTKNLAFNGEMRIDSATLALTYIDAELPRAANLNFIHNLRFKQDFTQHENAWISQKEIAAWDMTYELLKEHSSSKSPELLISKKIDFLSDNDDFIMVVDSFANSPYSRQQLDEQMVALQSTPFYKTASYIIDALITGHFRLGFVDIGPFVDIIRLTEIEGFRTGIPLRTNERFMKNLMLGGHAMYGFRDQKWKYAAEAQVKLTVPGRMILGAKYLNDYRRIDYDYNDFQWREDPISTGDENILNTVFAFHAQHRMSMREEMSAFLYFDINRNIESKLIFRNVNFTPNELLPLTHNGEVYDNLNNRNITLTGRFSFGQYKNDRHFQRLYVKTPKPIIYTTLDLGDYRFGDKSGQYAKLSGNFLQQKQSFFGDSRVMLETGKIFGDVPYPLLKHIQGKDGRGYNRFEFTMMNNREYITDSYVNLFGEHIFNGIIFNRIPLIKHLNLREIVGFKASYGTLSDRHAELMDIPSPTGKFTKPYSEASIGLANLLGVLTVQSVWRLSDLDKPDINRWGIKFDLLLSF